MSESGGTAAKPIVEKMFSANDETKLDEARAWLSARLDKGAECPCCSQLAKIYRRPINSSMAYVLILIERRFREAQDWLHVPSYLNELGLEPKVAAAIRGDWAKLVHWGLLVEMPGERPDGSTRVGFYKITESGIEFVRDNKRVPKYVYIYDGAVLPRECEEMVSIQDALAEKFDYSKLMGWRP